MLLIKGISWVVKKCKWMGGRGGGESNIIFKNIKSFFSLPTGDDPEEAEGMSKGNEGCEPATPPHSVNCKVSADGTLGWPPKYLLATKIPVDRQVNSHAGHTVDIPWQHHIHHVHAWAFHWPTQAAEDLCCAFKSHFCSCAAVPWTPVTVALCGREWEESSGQFSPVPPPPSPLPVSHPNHCWDLVIMVWTISAELF